MKCFACPRMCGIERNGENAGNKKEPRKTGFCGVTDALKVARAALHFWEEPVISGSRGSGTVFFSGCNMGCVFCQNSVISRGRFGKEITDERFLEICASLKAQGAHNINLVTPTHFIKRLLPLLDKIDLPVVWNSSAYENVEALKGLEGKVDIFLPDFKYALSEPAKKYSLAQDYPEKAKKAIAEMLRQTGNYVIKDGIMRRGVIIRHLILPENLENTYRVIDFVADSFQKGEVLFSLMSQYTPYSDLPYPELNRRITKREYILARNYMLKRGVTEGFVQELSSAREEYTPSFDLTGV